MIKELIFELKKMFGLELLQTKFWFTLVAVSSGLGVMMEFIEIYVWSPGGAYITFLLLLIFDFVSAVKYAWKAGNFETRKLPRILYKLIAYTCLFAISHNLAKYDPFYFWLPQAIYFPCVSILLLSFIKNLSLLGFIPERISEIITKKIDVYKNFEVKKDDDGSNKK